MSQNLISMIDALRTGKAADAQTAFSAAMSEKVNAALDAAKVQVASQIYNKVAEDVHGKPTRKALALKKWNG